MKIKRCFPFFSVLAILVLTACSPDPEEAPERPRDPWAFRSVLDRKPRMLSLALDTACYAAYDLEKGQVYKVWKGGILAEGTVFTNKKNIQPGSWGTSYYKEGELPDKWVIAEGGRELGFETKFRGYLLRHNRITLNFDFLLNDGRKISLQESPEFTRDQGGNPGFERSFQVVGKPAGLSLELISENGTVRHIIDDETVIRDYFERLPAQQAPSIGDSYDHLGILWMENSDCYTCHEEHNAMVGPSFEQIASRYPKDKNSYALLTSKIKEGGKGRWGETPMNPHPDLAEKEIKTILDYIFTFKTEESSGEQQIQVSRNVPSTEEEESPLPGHGAPLQAVHPSYDLTTLHREDFQPRVGGLAFLPDERLLVSTWDSLGAVYLVEGIREDDPAEITVKRVAEGLAEPLGLEVVDGEIFVLQKHELTQLIDHDGDEVIDEYKVVCDAWGVTDDFHEFAFGLVHKDDHFYITLSMAMRLMANERQLPDRGRTLKISRDGSYETIDYGLRTPNGIGLGMDEELFVTDNQGQWLPANKLIHVQQGAYNGMAWGLTAGQEKNPPEMVPPAIWLPDKEIGNSPSEPVLMKDGPYKGQLLHGDVSHGGIKRDFLEKVNGQYQGAVFRFSQGFAAGVNRLVWGPDGALYVGEVGMVGGWSWKENQFGLERLSYNGEPTAEMLAIRARSDGFEIEFTQPMNPDNFRPEMIHLEQWRYEPTASYGGPKLDLEELVPEQADWSADGKKLYLKLRGLREKHVIYFKISEQLRSKSGDPLWSSEAWYTLNHIPKPTEPSQVAVRGRAKL
ncbi:cytochrome c [Cyclobacterium lianum]|uniref:Cytochrome c n=1 Tax=Cyclobacterium lianum TaxID=388280 RepID=A0A1M7LDU5_9BACT|nr:c-type cytochrome [Cyclobacterium lianum]SHM75783.1 cytochrome c [Cyclobacterium lianum]